MITRSLIALSLCATLLPMVACQKTASDQTPATTQEVKPLPTDTASQDPGIAADSLSMNMSEADTRALAPVLSGYLDIQEALASTKHDLAMEHAKKLKLDLDRVILTKKSSNTWKDMSSAFKDHTHALTQTEDINAARVAFVTLSSDMQAFLEAFGNVTDEPVRKAFCPMAMDNKGGMWFQRSETVDNTYYGDEMRQCGEIQATVEPTKKLM